MKRIFTVALVLFAFISKAQLLTQSEVQEIKRAKLIIGLSENDSLNAILIKSVNNIWKFSKIAESMPLDEAYEKVKKDNSYLVICISTKKSSSLNHSGALGSKYKYVATGIEISIRAKRSKAVAEQAIPVFGEESTITEEGIIFGLTAMQFTFKSMIQADMNNNLKMSKAYDLHKHKLKKDTLYILEGWLDDKLNTEEIAKLYKKKFKIVSYDEWRNAIISKKPSIAYLTIAAIPVGGNFIYHHYLVSAETGNVYAEIYPKFMASVNLGEFKRMDLSKKNSGLVKKKNIEDYVEVITTKD